jgi:hypothetical protein
LRLLNLGPEGVQKLIESMDKNCEAIRSTALSLAWYMRGGASYEDILNMSSAERNHISKLVEKNLETTKNTKMPFF